MLPLLPLLLLLVGGAVVASDVVHHFHHDKNHGHGHSGEQGTIWVQVYNNTAFGGTPIYDSHVEVSNEYHDFREMTLIDSKDETFRLFRGTNIHPWTSVRFQAMIRPPSSPTTDEPTAVDKEQDDHDADDADGGLPMWEFLLTSDQGYARLWIDHHLMIDQWMNNTSSNDTTKTTTSMTTAKSIYPIPIPYIRRKTSSLVHLDMTYWQEVPKVLELTISKVAEENDNHTVKMKKTIKEKGMKDRRRNKSHNNELGWIVDSNLPRSELTYQHQRHQAERGWNTWLSADMLSHTLLPSGLTLSMKFYSILPNGTISNVIEHVASPSCDKSEFPIKHGIHSSRGQYTEIEELYLDDHMTYRIESAATESSSSHGSRLVILPTPVTAAPQRRATESRNDNDFNNTEESPSYWITIRLEVPNDFLPRYCEEPQIENDQLSIVTKCPGFETMKVVGAIHNISSSLPVPFESIHDHDGTVFLQAKLPIRIGEQTIIQAFPSTTKPLPFEEAVSLVHSSRQTLLSRISKANNHNETMSGLLTAIGWNVIYTPYEGIITPVFRGSPWWLSKPHDYVLFEWDTYFASIIASYIDDVWVATNNIIRMTQTLFYQGFVVGFWNGQCGEFDKSKPPIGTMAVDVLVENFPNQKWVIDLLLDHFLEWNDWWTIFRMPMTGLIAPGSSQYNSNLSVFCDMNAPPLHAAACETGLDNSPIYDSASFLDDRYIMDHIDVGMTSFFVRDCDTILRLAKLIGRDDGLAYVEARSNNSKQMVEEHFWNPSEEIYINKNWRTNKWIPRDIGSGNFPIAPTSFYPWLYDTTHVDIARVENMIVRYLSNTSEFGVNNETQFGIPSISRSSSSFKQQNYWRGRIWGPMNFLVYLGLLRFSNSNSAIVNQARADLAMQSEQTFLVEWSSHHRIMENFDAVSGSGCNRQSANPFYHWGALNALIPLLEDGIVSSSKNFSNTMDTLVRIE